jgi:hypothetical protein
MCYSILFLDLNTRLGHELHYLVVAQRYPVVAASNVVVKPPSGVDTYVEESSNIKTKY